MSASPHRTEPHPEIATLEAELDKLWGASRPKGGWRAREPFDKAEIPTLRRVKWLLKRRVSIMAGRDWPVEIVTPDPRNPRRCFAVAREPAGTGDLGDPRNPVSPVAWHPPASTALVFELSLPLSTVERALAEVPAPFRSDDGMRQWCRLVHSFTQEQLREASPTAPQNSTG
jgi:hypothetical protein